MLPLKRIVCPIDFQSSSRTALRIANEMALYFSADLIVVHVVHPAQMVVAPVESMGVGRVTDGMTKRTDQDVVNAQKRMAEEVHDFVNPEVSVRLDVRVGEPASTIMEVATEVEADALILATSRHGRLHNMLFGSVANKIMHEATCPIISIHGAGEQVSDETAGVEGLQEQEIDS